MSNGQTYIFLMTSLVCATVVVLAIASAVVSSRKKKDQSAALDSGVRDRLERMEHAIDSIAVEVERVSESQRFVTKLMAERRPAPPSIPERVITPH
jgi:hypothetical protein